MGLIFGGGERSRTAVRTVVP